MKRLFMLLCAVVAFAACEQAPIKEMQGAVINERNLEVSLEVDDTRIQLNEAQKTVWTEGDHVSVFYRSTINEEWQFMGETGDRTGQIVPVDNSVNPPATHNHVVVAYPYSADYFYNTETHNVEASLPAVQSYLKDSYGTNGNIMISSSEFNKVSLKSVCGWLKLQLTGDGEVVKSITLRGNDGEQVAGELYINTSDATCVLASASGDAGESEVSGTLVRPGTILTEVTLDCGDGVALGKEATAFYIALPPQTFEQGFTVEIEGTEGYVMEQSTDKALTIERNTIKPMAAFEFINPNSPTQPTPANNEIWYTSSNGKVVKPYKTNVFGATIISNEYNNGMGVITFDGDVTSIGYEAFYDCDSLTSVTIGDSVTTIGNNAFFDCDSLTSVNIPDSVTEIGDYAFNSCSSLTSIIIPNSVTQIGEYAFYWCRCLTSITIPDSVTTINDYAFFNCAYKSITLPANIIHIGNQVLYSDYIEAVYCKPTTPPSLGENSSILTKNFFVYVPKESINDYRTAAEWSEFANRIEGYDFETGTHVPSLPFNNQIFYTSSSNSIISPKQSKEKVVSNKMINGKGIIEFDGEITAIMRDAFSDNKLLTSITLPSSVTTIERRAFSGCSNLQSVKNIDNVTSIGESAFYYCSNLLDITFGNKLTTIDNYAFRGCSNLRSVSIPNSIEYLGKGIFNGCTNLEEFKGKGATNEGKALVLDGTLYALIANDTECIIPNGVINIASNTFWDYNNFQTVTIPEGVRSIGDSAFNNCQNIKNIEFPQSLETIGEFAFYSCSNIENIKLHSNTHTIGLSAFCDCTKLSNIILSRGLINIGGSAFSGCEGLTTITLPSSIKKIGAYAFSDCRNLLSVYSRATTPPEAVFLGDYWDAFKNNAKDRKIYIPSISFDDYGNTKGWTPYRFDLVSYNFKEEDIDPDSVPDDCKIYYTSTNGSSINPNNEINFGANILVNSYENGTGVLIFDGTVTKIGESAFKNVNNLKSITIPNSVTSIMSEAFYNCTNLEKIDFGTGVTYIGNKAFENCRSLESISIPKNISQISKDAFTYCTTLKKIYIESLKSWCSISFSNGTNLLIDNRELYLNNELITDLNITSDITEIKPYAFCNYIHLKSVTIGGSVKRIDTSAFQYCDNLKSVNMLDGLSTIGKNAFYYCENLKDVTIGNNVETIGNQAFYGCKSITNIVIPDSITTIGSEAFRSCSALENVTFGHGIKDIGYGAFCKCGSLNAFEGWLASDDGMCLIIDGRLVAFICDCPITPYTFPDNITVIGKRSVLDCETVTEFIIPDTVTSIEPSAFEYCFNLKKLTIGANVETIGYWAFSNCFALKTIYCRATTPPKPTYYDNEWLAFDEELATRKIYVPMESVEAYKNAEGWSIFADKIVGYNF